MENYILTHHNERPYITCPITRESFTDDTLVIVLGCGHYFSVDGIKPWLSDESTKCPCCNADVRDTLIKKEEEEEEEEEEEIE